MASLNMSSVQTNESELSQDLEQIIFGNKLNLTEKSWIKIYTLPKECQLTDFESLWNLIPSERATITVFGKQHKVPRFLKAYGQDYHFSNENHTAEPIKDPFLLKLLHHVWMEEKNTSANGILVNWYRDGNDYIGPHSDDEKTLIPGAPIYSFSFGAERDFVLKNKKTKECFVFKLKDNTVCIMGGDCQKEFTHTIPKRLKCKERRINVTIREFTE